MIPDLERLLTRLTSGNSGRQKANVVLYEDANRQRLKPFLAMLKGLVVIKTMVHDFTKHQAEIDSQLLKELLTPGLGMPRFQAELEFFETSFDWDDAEENGRIIPSVKGTSKSYDDSMSQVPPAPTGVPTARPSFFSFSFFLSLSLRPFDSPSCILFWRRLKALSAS